MATKIFATDVILTEDAFLQLGFETGNLLKEEYVPVFDRERALSYLRSHPELAVRLLSKTGGNGTVFWAGDLSAVRVDGGSVGVQIVRRRDGEEAVGDNMFGHFLEGVLREFRRELSDMLVDEVPVRPGQVISDFTRKGAYMSDIEERERSGESFIHVDVYRPAKFRFDAGRDGTTGHASRVADAEVPFHRFVCPFGTSYPSPIIVGSAAEASILYEQALRGEIDWKALFNELRNRNLLDSKLNAKQIDNLIADYRAQFDWMREEIVNNPSLRQMTIVGSSWMVPDASMGRSVYDAQTAPSPAHVLARYINNPLLLYTSGENGVIRSLGMMDKGEPERFSEGLGRNDNPLNVLIAGSDTIGGREPGRKATSQVVRKEGVDAATGQRVITTEKRAVIPTKSKEAVERDYALFSARLDAVLSGVGEGQPVRLIAGNVSSFGDSVGVGTPRMVERYVRERGGDVYQYDFVKKVAVVRGENKSEKPNPNLSVVLMEHFAECLPVLVGNEESVEFLLNANVEDSGVKFADLGLEGNGLVCFSSVEDTNNRNVLSVGSLAVDAGLPVVHVMDNLSEDEQRRHLSEGALISRSGHPEDMPVEGLLFGSVPLRTDWDFSQANHLSSVDEVTGLHFPSVATTYPSPMLVEGYPFRSPLGAYVALVASSMGEASAEFMQSIIAVEGSSAEVLGVYDRLLDGKSVSEYLSDIQQERCLRSAIRGMAQKNDAFMESLLDLDGRDIVISSNIGNQNLFVSPDGKGENRFGIALAAERDAMKQMREGRRLAEEQERVRLVDEAAKRQKIVTGARAEGQKIVGGLPQSIEQSRDAVWFIGTHNPLSLALKDEETSFVMWNDMNGEDPLVREKAARPYVDDGEGGKVDNNFIFLFPTDLESFTGRRSVRNMPDSKNLTGVTRVDPVTGVSFLAAVGIPVRFNNRGNELMNADNMPCSYRLDNDASNFAASIVLSDSKARSTAIRHGQALSLPGRERMDGSSYYTLGQVFMDKYWNKKEQKMVDNPHKSPLNLSLTETYISLLESGSKYPLNCVPLPRGQYLTQDDAVVRKRLDEGQRFVSAEGRFISDLMLSLQIANATALALGVPLRFPLDKDGHIDLGPGVPEEYRMMAEKRIDSFIGVRLEQDQVAGKLPKVERIPLYAAGSVRDLLTKAGMDLYMRPNDLAVAFGPYDFSSILSGMTVPLHEMAFRLDDGTVFTVKDAKSTRGLDNGEINRYLNYTKNDERRFVIRTTDPEKTPLFINALKAYSERAKAVQVQVRLVRENEVSGQGMEGFVNLLSSNSESFAESEHDIGREMTVFNASGTVNKEGAVSSRNIDGEDVSSSYWGRVDAKDGFKGYAQIKYTLPNGDESSWRTITDLELAKDTVMSLVNRTYRSDMRVVPSESVMEMLHKAVAVEMAGDAFRDFVWSAGKKEAADDKVVVLDNMSVPSEKGAPVEAVKEIREFKDENRFLSNFWPCQVLFEGKMYPSSENAYQAAKCVNVQDRVMFENITPAEAKKLGKEVTVRSDWDSVKDEIMRAVILDKFSRNEELGAKLLATGDIALVEGNRWNDTYWGVDLASGKGENRLGEVLMETRGFIRSLSESAEVKPVSEESARIEYTVSDGGYQKRTYENANADDVDFTIAVGVDFSTYGERATAKAAGDSLISVEVEDFSDKAAKKAVKEIFSQLPEEFQQGEPFGVNFAGNGLYTLAKEGIEQSQVDEFMVKVISGLQSKGVVLQCGRSGGQTGVDEAALVAGVVCGVPMTCHAPKGWLMRDGSGKDQSGEDVFKSRFEKKDYKKLSSLVVRQKAVRNGKGQKIS